MGFFDTYNAELVEPQGAYQPIPEGQYSCLIIAAAEKPTKAGNGMQMVLELEVIAPGDHAKRRLYDRITLQHPNKQAEEIGARQLSAYCHAVGIMRPRGAHDFVGKTVKVKVAIRKRDDNGELTNEVKGVVLAKSTDTGSTQKHNTPPSASSDEALW
jgi:hypothetical protein